MEEKRTRRNYKDTIFRMLFQKKEDLLSLYNAINGTAYENVENLKITTLENAVYMNYKNDISFVLDFELMLYEHQSTANPNMPLRDLIYVTTVLQGLIRDENLYSEILVKIPFPRFVVFYNGVAKLPERQTLKLSDAYEKSARQPELELFVTVYNINYGRNQKLMEACRLLKEYAEYVQTVRDLAREMPFPEAVSQAVEICIQKNVLADFLTKNRVEAIAVSIFEYDEEKHLKSEREYSYKMGREEGFTRGREEGLTRGREEGLTRGREEGLTRGREEGIRALIEAYQEFGMAMEAAVGKLMETFGLSKEEAGYRIEKYWRQ